MRHVRKIGIITNTRRDKDLSKTGSIVRILEQNGITAVLPSGGMPAQDDVFNKSDLLITLGGDGTILSAAEMAAMLNIPILGINIGNLGYLTDCAFEEAEQCIKRLISGEFVRQKRMMLEAAVSSESNGGLQKHCLNDVCVTRGAASKIISFDLYINDNFVDNLNADGIIISTPTGSTAYNLSAGGPILIPSSEMIAVTPVCPHMLTTRPIVVSSAERIVIKLCDAKKETMLTLDGREPRILCGGDSVSVRKSDISVDIIKTNKLDFYDILRQKLICAGNVDS